MDQTRIGAAAQSRKLGMLSEKYESGGRGPGTVSGGQGDPGGVSYGLYQLASRTGTAAAFLGAEGRPWAAELPGRPGSAEFSQAWKAIALRDAEAFADAQHAFIERTHYRPAVAAVKSATGLDLDGGADALRDAVWSTAVQHGSAARILAVAVQDADARAQRDTPAHERACVEAIYARRTAHVLAIAAKAGPAVRRTLTNVAHRRYPDERAAALAMLGQSR
ncbi:MAG: hypothetical protein ACKOPO_08755 [Novosphingobium sp.]